MTGRARLGAVLWMIGATCSFAAMAVAGREIAADHDTFELMLYRSIIGVGIVLGLGGLTGHLGEIRFARFRLHLVRNVGHFTGQNLWFFAVATIPLAQVVALEFTTPLWVALAAPLLLGEALTWRKGLAVLLGFAGVLVVARPGAVELEPGVIAAALCAIGFAVSYIATKALSETETTTGILFWLTAMQTVFALVCAGFDGDIAAPVRGAVPFLVLVSICGLSAHYCLTRALMLAPASVVAPLDFARLPLVAVVGWALYGEPFALAILAGGALILVANFLNLRSPAVTESRS
ncbi:DMT family transporter [Pontivivens ytuae]|uniref:DMT family transporter n=1 Tax=Pontivivens ytuae TaxID=2789856 RepID=A0A7S9LRL3_9RHOB|nr:DMT family transporter [Pontivivens ytuae]QPH53846.1 DMT family transporter [Pontivivens ytuae]